MSFETIVINNLFTEWTIGHFLIRKKIILHVNIIISTHTGVYARTDIDVKITILCCNDVYLKRDVFSSALLLFTFLNKYSFQNG